jgi:hypothetical protein
MLRHDPDTRPAYLAEVAGEVFDWDDNLTELLSRVRRDADPGTGEDAVVWATTPRARVLAVVRADGEVVPLTARGVAG